MCSDNQGRVDSSALACLLAFGLLVLIMGGLIYGALSADKREAQRRHQAIMAEVPPVVQRWQALFEKLDADGDGLLHEEELRNASLEGGFTGEDKKVVDFLYERCHDVGHVVGQYRSGKYTYSIYGISKADLRALPEKAKLLWGQ